jgi:hypothetical protein
LYVDDCLRLVPAHLQELPADDTDEQEQHPVVGAGEYPHALTLGAGQRQDLLLEAKVAAEEVDLLHRPDQRAADSFECAGHIRAQGRGRGRRRWLLSRAHRGGRDGTAHGGMECPAVTVPVADQRVVERVG